MPHEPFHQRGAATILILAGRRDADGFAAAHGCTDKCLVPVGGRPMIDHILSAAAASDAQRILVSTHNAALLDALDPHLLARLGKRLRLVQAADNLAESVLGAARAATFPMLVTTADNCLLTPETMVEIDQAGRRANAGAAVALARREDVLAAHAAGQRRFYAFTDVAVSNCNAYWIAGRGALKAVEAFRGGGQFVKKPMRVLRAFGFINLLRFRFGLGPIHHVFGLLSRRLGVTVVPVLIRDGATAIDVDNDRSLSVTEEMLRARQEFVDHGAADDLPAAA